MASSSFQHLESPSINFLELLGAVNPVYMRVVLRQDKPTKEGKAVLMRRGNSSAVDEVGCTLQGAKILSEERRVWLGSRDWWG